MQRLLLIFTIFLKLGVSIVNAQALPNQLFNRQIHTIMVHPLGNPQEPPVVLLNGGPPLQISFDDFSGNFEDYQYSLELVDSAWNPIEMNPFDYISGFNQNKINQYAASSMVANSYIHYEFSFPNSNCKPRLSGNYILKVFKGTDTGTLVFTRGIYVVESLAGVAASVEAPFDGDLAKTHQRIKASVDIRDVPYFQQDRIRLKVIQNNRYQDAKTMSVPNFIRGTILEYNNENDLIFPAGKEYRWLDLQSLRLKSDRIATIDSKQNTSIVYLKTDISRSNLLYDYYKDLNGCILITNTESLQSETQNDYAQVVFSYLPPDRKALLDKHLYLSGALTNNILDNAAEMLFAAQKGLYTKTLLLKQGYYSYQYVLVDRMEPNSLADYTDTEGNHWETENRYIILVYYRAPGTRNDQIIGFTNINSRQNW
jgi:hypothetical protein